jgi:L-2-hydroxyglutarate oxidase LhgO
LDHVQAIVIGAGVVGLAIARRLAMAGHEVLILEAERAIGTGVSSRNSCVVHAGIYYEAGSVKARVCVAGKHALYAFCESHGVSHRRTGKLVVATDRSQLPALHALKAKAAANGVRC